MEHQINFHQTNDEIYRSNIMQNLKNIEKKILLETEKDYEIVINVEYRDCETTNEQCVKQELINTKNVEQPLENFCELCHATFDNDQELNRHKLNMHLIQHDSTYDDKDSVFLDDPFANDDISDQQSIDEKPNTCKRELTSKQSFKNNENFTCEICNRIFYTTKQLKIHSKIHSNSRSMYKCDLCKNEYFCKSTLLKHMQKMHCNQKQYKCESKPKQKYGNNDNKLNNSNLQCNICNRICLNQNGLYLHLKTHTKNTFQLLGSESIYNYGLTCDICGGQYSNRKNLCAHMKTHVKKRPVYKCTECTKTYLDSGSFREHKKNHAAIGQKAFKCLQNGCDKVFAHSSSRRQHFKSAHLSTSIKNEDGTVIRKKINESVLCDYCGRKYPDKKRLIIHLRIHAPNRELYKCEQCSRKFYKKNSLSDHMKQHIGIKQYTCLFGCGEAFVTTHLRRYHETIMHKPEKHFTCKICSKISKTKNCYM